MMTIFSSRTLFQTLSQTIAVCLLAAASLTGPAQAQMRIDITGVGANQFPIAIANFADEANAPQKISGIIRDDLARSGQFKLIDTTTVLNEITTPNFSEWKSKGSDALVGGSITRLADGRYDVRFRLYDAVKQSSLGGLSFVSSNDDLRLTAHKIADFIYEKLTGDRGIFATRIAFVMKSGGSYRLQVADSDGQNAVTALTSKEPIISPAWSPDGGKLAYVSFENRKPVVYVHQLATGRRSMIANFKGSNSAPAWSPDGSRLAVVLTRDGQSQIYLMSAEGGEPRKLTSSSGIDTEPEFSADGSTIYFTSDRGGSPQIYRVSASGGEATRITFKSPYSISPRISPDGKTLAYISLRGGRFQVISLDLASGTEQLLTDSFKDESPTFAPNGKIILYATDLGGRGVLASVTTDGRVRQKLSVNAGDVREPTWGPFTK